MKRRELEKALLVLETTPLLLNRIGGISPALARQMRIDGASVRDRMWGLAILEKDLWNRAIRRLLAEENPRLQAIEQSDLFLRASFVEGDHREALRVFGVLRGQNVRLLRQTVGRDWERPGTIGPNRPIRLFEVPAAMARSDERHQSKLLRIFPAEEPARTIGPEVLSGFCA